MASKDPNPDSTDPHQAPTLALKQALCFSCWDVSSNLSRCSACKRVSYCSAKCQKQDWNRNHKKICKKLVALNKLKGYVPSAGRHWNDYYDEQVHHLTRRASRFWDTLQVLEFLKSDTLNPSELGRLVGYVHSPVTDENRSLISLGTITILYSCRRNSQADTYS